MNKNKFCVSKRQIFVVSLLFIFGCFIVLISYINKAKLYTQSRASDIEFTKINITPGPNEGYLTDCHDAVNSSACQVHCVATYGNKYGCSGSKCCLMPECTTTVGSGGGVESVKKALLGAYFPNQIPNSITMLNRNGDIKWPLNTGDYQEGDLVSLVPKDHATIRCKGQYLGDIVTQAFSDGLFHNSVSTPYLGGHYIDKINYFESPLALGSSTEPRGSVYGLLLNLCSKFYTGTLGNIDSGCNFTTVVKTSAVGGIQRCEVFSSMPNALSWISGGFVSDEYASPHIMSSSPSDIKTLAIAILPKIESAPFLKQIFTDLCPNP